MTPWLEPARLFLRKARQDDVIVQLAVNNEAIADDVVGFHVQQVAEKCAKAVLAAKGISFRRTHDLQELFDLLLDSDIDTPLEFTELAAWSSFAVLYRYEDLPMNHPIDRRRATELASAAITWAAQYIPASVQA